MGFAVKAKPGDWMKWLTTDECVYLLWLTIKPTPYRDEWRRRRMIQVLRTRAAHRRKAKYRKFAIYLKAMED